MGLRATIGSPAPAIPGELSHCDVTVENTGAGHEDTRLSIAGEPAAWGWVTPATLSLGPGQQGVARLTFKLPRAPHPPAGPLDVTVIVAGAGAPLDVAGTFEVAPFDDVFAGLEPQTCNGRCQLRVENRGNATTSVTLEGRGEGVAVKTAPDLLTLAPGDTAVATVTARAGRRPLRGPATSHPFEVLVQPTGSARTGRAEGTVELAPGGWFGRAALLLLVLAVAGIGLAALTGSAGDGPAAEPAVAGPAPADCPARDHLSPDANGIVREGVRPAFDYTFLFVTKDGCHPVRFNPCQPVRYALNRGLATDAHVADLVEALGKLSDATGLQFERVADTNEDPRRVPPPRRQADGTVTWPPIVIGWARLGAGDALRGPNDRRADPDIVVGGGGRPQVVNEVVVTGNLVLNLNAVTDTDSRAQVPHGFGTGVNWGRIILHELAHVIGLGHVESRTSIMNEALTQQTLSSANWGVGDLIGLRHLGRDGGCVAVPPVPPQGAPR